MLKAAIAALSIFLVAASDSAKWKWEVRHDRPGEVVLDGHTPDGFDTFRKAVEAVPEGTRIKYIRLGGMATPEADDMRAEIYAYLEANYPAELKAALSSAGNLHNPKVIALHGPFREALLSTSYVAGLNEVLMERCHRVTRVLSEKFMISKREKEPYFHAVVWLRAEKCAAAAELREPQSKTVTSGIATTKRQPHSRTSAIWPMISSRRFQGRISR